MTPLQAILLFLLTRVKESFRNKTTLFKKRISAIQPFHVVTSI
jgi:hypothetical protein